MATNIAGEFASMAETEAVAAALRAADFDPRVKPNLVEAEASAHLPQRAYRVSADPQ